MRFFRPWIIIRWLCPDTLFRIKTSDRVCCLTFDDGPDPASTLRLLDLLDHHRVKALFFCTGSAAEKYPHLMEEISNRGHLTGNHGYNHPDGWRRSTKDYIDDINKASEITSRRFFRPPYGHLTISQFSQLRKMFRIILWDIMSYDFDNDLDPVQSLNILKKKLRPGSIIVMHDIPGHSFEITRGFLEYAGSTGYSFVLPE